MSANWLESALTEARVIPVVTIDDADCAVGLAETLLQAGVGVMEITLRSSAALVAIERIAHEVPAMLVGAGTVRDAQALHAAKSAGAQFAVSPGSTSALLAAALSDSAANTMEGLPLIPGVATASEVMVAMERDYRLLKFFPAEAQGGVNFLRSMAGPFPTVRFCPTGGITGENAGRYLSLPNVVCVGGSWLVPRHYLGAQNWSELAEHVSQCLRALHPTSQDASG